MIDTRTLLTRYRNIVVNVGVLFVAFLIMRSIYGYQNNKINDLRRTRDIEIRKNELLKKIDESEKRIEAYQRAFGKKEVSEVVNAITQIARDSKVRIISIRPGGEKKQDHFSELMVDVNVHAADYHSVGEFVSRLENSAYAYTVNYLYIKSQNIQEEERKGRTEEDRLRVETSISTIIFQ